MTGNAASTPMHGVDAIERVLARLYHWMALAACALLVGMMLVICGDVLLRNLAFSGLPRGIALANDLSENALYLITLLAAPWLLHLGQHIRVDFVLRAIPPAVAWICEWISDLLALAACGILAWYGMLVAWSSYRSGSILIKTIVTPEWWYLAPLPLVFLLLMVELVFRMRRLFLGPREHRDDRASAA